MIDDQELFSYYTATEKIFNRALDDIWFFWI